MGSWSLSEAAPSLGSKFQPEDVESEEEEEEEVPGTPGQTHLPLLPLLVHLVNHNIWSQEDHQERSKLIFLLRLKQSHN
jgi:hypothetical protein